MKAFTIVYACTTMSGERGWSYDIYSVRGAWVGGGWSAGRKREAESDARAYCLARSIKAA